MCSPGLTHLHWSGPAISAPWFQLHYLSFCTFHPSELESILPRLVNLVELHLVNVEYGVWERAPDAPYLLATITTLSLQHDCERLLELLTLPHLEHLVLAKVWLSVHAQSLRVFLDRSSCKLKSLELQGWGMDTLHDYYRHPAIQPSLTRLAISSEALTRFFDMLEAESPETLPPSLHLFLRPIDICFQIDGLRNTNGDETWDGTLAMLLLSSLPNLAALELDLGVFTEGELESHLVSTPKGQLRVRRPTCQREEYERWWGSEEGQEFRRLRRSQNRDALEKFSVDWAVVDGSLPQSRDINVYSSAANGVDGSVSRIWPPYGRNLLHDH
ncbi:hypothetical protein B0H19DRAFT_1072404 [Mycena capillaripes]|nr:hypothetical protein B0H19DRAFT_1072404 [Mycena capillaripes]